ncbi:MAG TPA: hypothetical protein VFU80_02535 [Sphingomicrobium sp.]|nr:hypothetical protein [Sphingomicrobium sp.]
MLLLFAAIAMEAIAQPSLPGFVVGYNVERDGNSITEQVPSGETVQKWTRMVTTQRFAGVARRTDADGFLQLMLNGLQQACPGATVAYRRPATRSAQMRVDCPLNPATGLPETFFAKAMPGAADMHVAQVAFRRDPSGKDVDWAEGYLAKVDLKP